MNPAAIGDVSSWHRRIAADGLECTVRTLTESVVALRAIKLVHTLVWAFFAGAILAIPITAWQRWFGWVLILAVVVLVEVAILAFNGMRCPLTAMAARYTDDRRGNFDIYLPLWLATYNKQVFGALFLAGILFALLLWVQR
jgi:polyferredoxin